MDDFRIENRLEKLKIFLCFCRSCVSYGYLNLRNEELMDECIQVATFYDSICQQIARYNRLGQEMESMYQWEKAINCYEKGLTIAKEIGDMNSAVTLFNNLGNIYQSISNYTEAIKYHKKALEIAESVEDRKGVANSYTFLGITFKSLGKYKKAKDCHEKCLKIAKERNDKKGILDAYGNLGDAYYVLEDTNEAIKCHELSLNIALEIGDRKGVENAYGNLGIAFHSLNLYKDAIGYLEKSLKASIERKDELKQEIVYGNLGVVYQSLNEYKKAIGYHEASKKIAITIGDKEGEALSYVNIGNSYQSMGKYQEAIINFEKALKMAKDMDYVYGEEIAYFNLANSYHLMGKENEALKYYEHNLSKIKEIGNDTFKQREATTYLNLGNVFQSLGEYGKAQEYYEYSMKLAAEIECKDIIAKSYGNLAGVFEATGKCEKAIKYAEDCIKISGEIGDKKGVSSANANIAASLVKLGSCEEAIKYRDKQLDVARYLGDKYGETNAYLGLGMAYGSMAQYQKAMEYQRKALEIARETQDKREEGNANTYIGISLLAQGYFYKEKKDHEKHYECIAKSRSFLESSIQCWEWLYEHSVQEDKIKISFADTFHLSYRVLTRILIEAGQHEEALLVSERGRARALNDLLTSRYSLPLTNYSFTNPLQFSDVRNVISCASFCLLFYAYQDTSIAIYCLSQLNPLIFARDEIKGFKDKGCFRVPEQNQLEQSIGAHVCNVVNAAYDKMKVRDGTTCEDRSFQTSVTNHQANNNDNVSEKISSAFLHGRNITEENDNYEDQLRCIEEYEQQDEYCENPLEVLFEGLISPVQQDILCDEVVFAPEGPLNLIPFAALKDPSTGTYLSETKRIRLVPSLITLKVLKECPSEMHRKTGALIIGNPKVGQVKLRGKIKTFTNLRYAEEEAQMISSLLGVQPIVGVQATKQLIMQKLREGVAVIHFAAHGNTDGEIALAPLNSIQTRFEPEEDYLLTMSDVQESGARPQLVVLSCCHSGRGEIKSEGVVGMSRAFLAAGARAVVASLWAIDDKATLFFMEKFYLHLRRGESAGHSLQQAMKEMREGVYSEPRYWAPFFLIGDDVTVECFQ